MARRQAAVAVQSGARRFFAQQHMTEARGAARRVQSAARGQRARAVYRGTRAAAVRVQTAGRGLNARREQAAHITADHTAKRAPAQQEAQHRGVGRTARVDMVSVAASPSPWSSPRRNSPRTGCRCGAGTSRVCWPARGSTRRAPRSGWRRRSSSLVQQQQQYANMHTANVGGMYDPCHLGHSAVKAIRSCVACIHATISSHAYFLLLGGVDRYALAWAVHGTGFCPTMPCGTVLCDKGRTRSAVVS